MSNRERVRRYQQTPKGKAAHAAMVEALELAVQIIERAYDDANEHTDLNELLTEAQAALRQAKGG